MKLFSSLMDMEGTPRSKKLNFMVSMSTMRILYARFLALYRWNIINQSRSISSRALSIQIANRRRVVTTLQTFSKQFSTMKIPSNYYNNVNNNFPLMPSDQDISSQSLARDIAVQMIQRSKSYVFIKCNYSHKILSIVVPHKYSFKIQIRSNGKRFLKAFNVNWPSGIKTDAVSNVFISLISSLVKVSADPIDNCCAVLDQLYQRGIFSKIYSILEDIQTRYPYHIALKEGKTNEALITFPSSFSPSNLFNISIDSSCVLLISQNPMLKSGKSLEKHFLSYILTTNYDYIESIINEVCISTFFTRLSKLWALISQSLSTISMHQFRGSFKRKSKCIEIYLFDYIVMRIEINPFSGEVEVNTFGGIGITQKEFICSIEGCECQRNEAIKIVFLHSLSKLLFSDILGNRSEFLNSSQNDGKSKAIRALNFSFSQDCHIVFGEKLGTPSISILSSDGSKVSTPEIMLVKITSIGDLKSKAIQAARSAKIAALLLQFVKSLKDHGISARFENDRVHFIMDPFECVEFVINQHSMWSLQFVKPAVGLNDILMLSFIGTDINARFVEWIINLVKNISTFMQMLKQATGVNSMKAIIRKLDVPNKTGFTIYMSHDFCSALTVTFSPLKILKSFSGSEVYQCNPMITPQINFEFSHHVQLKRHLDTILKSGSISFLFGSFLNSSFVPLQHFAEVFMGNGSGPDWSVTALRDDGSFFLIFQRKMSINFMLRPAQMFQLIIPSIGRSKVLQIPLESLPRLCHLSKLSHTTLKLHMSQLKDFKVAIEQFFYFRELLGKVGFESFISNGHEVYSPFPVNCPYVEISCFIRPTKIEFDAEGPDIDLAKYIKSVLNYAFNEVEIQVMAIRFVINILEFSQKFVSVVMQFMSKMVEKTHDLSLDWKTTFELTAVTLSEQKVMFNFATTHGTFYVELTSKETEAYPDFLGYDKTGSVSKFKTLKELTRWVDSLEPSDTE